MLFPAVILDLRVTLGHQRVSFHRRIWKPKHRLFGKENSDSEFYLPVKVELVNIRTILELTAGKDFKDPAKIESIVASSIFIWFPNFRKRIFHKNCIRLAVALQRYWDRVQNFLSIYRVRIYIHMWLTSLYTPSNHTIQSVDFTLIFYSKILIISFIRTMGNGEC